MNRHSGTRHAIFYDYAREIGNRAANWQARRTIILPGAGETARKEEARKRAARKGSVAPGGNSAAGDATTFIGNPLDDDDGNGIVNLLQYALSATSAAQLPSAGTNAGALTLTHRRNLASDDVQFVVERSTDLQHGSPAPQK